MAEHIAQRGRAPVQLGVDLGASPVRRALLLRAAQTGEQVASPPVALISAAGATGVVVFAPVQDAGGRLRGWISATYRADGLAAMVDRRLPGVRLTIRDGASPLLGGAAAPSGSPATVAVAGRTWQVWTSAPGIGFDAVPLLVLGLGVVLAIGVTLVLRNAVARERYASAQVAHHVAIERERQGELSEERRALAEAQTIARIGSWSVDRDGVTTWSDEMYRLFDRDPADGPILARAFLARLHPDDQQRIATEYQRALRSGDGFDLRARLLDGDGQVRHLRALGRRDAHDGYSGTVQDVTQATELREQLAMASARLQAVLEHAPMGIYMRDLDGRSVVANQKLAGIQGSSAGQLVGRTLEEVLDPDAAARVRASDESVIARGEAVRYEEMVPIAAGEDRSRTYLWEKFPVLDEQQRPSGVGGIALDMTDRVAIEKALRETDERFRGAFDEAPIGMAILDFEGHLTQVNEALAAMLGYSRDQLEGTLARDIAHPDEMAESREAMGAMRSGHRTSYSAEKRYITAAGESVACALQASVLKDSDGHPTAILSQILDITERKRYEAQLVYLADHDVITGLLNRRAFIRELTSHAKRGARYGAAGSVLMIDLDQFKDVNDTLGHHAGDELISAVAQLLGERLRSSDVLARLGGDEFAVLLPRAETADAEQVARGVLDALRRRPISIAGTERQITASIGIASFADQDGASVESIMIDADLAMYDAKGAGRDRYAVFDTELHTGGRATGRVSWA